MDPVQVARRLPEEFITAPGLPVQRALLLAYRYWPASPEPELRRLANALLVTLEPLLKSTPESIPQSVRNECERLVIEWGRRVTPTEQRLATEG
jgi:hypothetical protein